MSLRRRPQAPPPLIQHALLAQQPIPLSDGALIDHTKPVLHNTTFPFTNQVVSPNSGS
jgi:hypothetical protein